MQYESLHNHTTASDGPVSHLELLDAAAEHHIGTLVFTDHDVLPSVRDLKRLKEYEGPVKWGIGIEISSGLPEELGGGVTSMFHILGLFTDPMDADLREHSKVAVSAREERMTRIVKNLNGLGLTITADDCLRDSGGESVGRRNIANVLERYPQNRGVIDALRQKMATESVQSADTAMRYMRMMSMHPSDHPFHLFLSEDSWIPGVYVDYLYNVTMERSVELIRGAGGIAVVAHWPTISGKVKAEMLERYLGEEKLDGVELRTAFDAPGVREAEAQLGAMAERTGAFTTYGTDAHSIADLKRYTAFNGPAEKSVGQTARLIERYRPDLEWSNLA